MQVTETLNQSLTRGYGVRIPAAELGALLDARIAEITPTLRLKGFRPGRVPAGHVRRLYGKALMGEVIEKTINETTQQVLNDHNLRVASQPDLKPSSNMEQVLAGQEDLTYDLEVEVMPDFDPIDVSELSLTRLVYSPTESEIDEALAEVVAQNKTYAARDGESSAAEEGDQLLIDFVGRIGGEAFEGGSATDAEVVLGAGRFIPGFEAQLVGAEAGAKVEVNVAFPETYQVDRLKGQAAVFEVTVKEVRAPREAVADDALAQALGLADMPALREALRSNLEGHYRSATRFKLKRALLDALDGRHDIGLPSRMVEAEFESVWRQVKNDEESGEISPEDEGKPEEVLRAEYRKIAERRVRLGLVLAEIGRRENVVVSDQELIDAMRTEAMKYGEMAQKMFDLLRENPQAQANMRAPLYEEKVVDLILSKAHVTDQEVSKEELFKEDDLPEGISESFEPAVAEASAAAEIEPADAKPKAVASEDDHAETAAPKAKAKAKAKPRAAKVEPTAD